MDLPSSPPLDLVAIQHHLNKSTLEKLDDILIYRSVTSTNDVLWQRQTNGKNSPAVCLSETQTAGRGRHGDHWHSPATGNLYLSIFWPFPADLALNGLSIAIGISLINALKSEGINNLHLKWPNDVLYKRQKLAGILVESRFGKQQNTTVGIGLNFKLPVATQQQIKQPTTSLQQLCTEIPCRNRLTGKIINIMIATFEDFQHHGLHDIVHQWQQYDVLLDRAITLINHPQHTNAIARGINEQGELRYQVGNQLHTLTNSHISITFAL